MAASPGRRRGPRPRDHDADQLSEVQQGEILVATVTAPSWGPIFGKIKATVTDIGGMMSHAAIVCREYGLPAVTGTGSASTTIKTGQRLRVDGPRHRQILDGDRSRPDRAHSHAMGTTPTDMPDADAWPSQRQPPAPSSSPARPAASAGPSRSASPRRGYRVAVADIEPRRRGGNRPPGPGHRGRGLAAGRRRRHRASRPPRPSREGCADFGGGGIDVVVNNAAIYATVTRSPFEEIDPAEWDLVMDVNLKGPWLVTRAASPYLPEGGRVINLSSATVFSGSEQWLHYVASKGGVIALTRVMAKELGRRAITVNAIAPGFTLTEASYGLIENAESYGVDRGALKRASQPEDIVGRRAVPGRPGQLLRHRPDPGRRRRPPVHLTPLSPTPTATPGGPMTTVHFTDADGAVREVEANPGDSVMETAVRNGVPGIVAECGGSLSCATCHVFVRED